MSVSSQYDAEYYKSHCGSEYDRSNPQWLEFFGTVADELVGQLRPKRVLDVGCAKGFLVEALRDRGVEAYGIDISQYAIEQIRPDIRPYCQVRAATDPISEHFDLITFIEVAEHLEDEEGRRAIANLCAHSDTILFSSTPDDFCEPTHVNVRPLLHWLKLFRDSSFTPRLDFNACFVSPQAMLLCHSEVAPSDELLRFFAWIQTLTVQQARAALSHTDASRTPDTAELARQLAAIMHEAQTNIAGDQSQLQSIHVHVRSLQHHMASRDTKLESLREGLAVPDAEVARLQEELSDRDVRLNSMHKELKNREIQLQSMRAKLSSREATLNAVLNSKGWRLLNVYRSIRNRVLLPWTRAVPASAPTFPTSRGFGTFHEDLANMYRKAKQDGSLPNLRSSATSKEGKRQKVSLKIAAIIPLYNGSEFVEQALESVLSQTRMPDEVIVVDDGSTDDGCAKVEAVAQRHPLIRLLHKPNGGQSSARNFGVAHSTSDLIAFLDQDDLWYSRHLEVLEQPFKKEHVRELGWVYSELDQVDRAGGMVIHNLLAFIGTMATTYHPKRRLIDCLREDMFILPSASLISRRAFEKVGGFDERLCGCEDDDLFLRMYRQGYDNIFLPIALSKWRIYGTSTSYTVRMTQSRMLYAEKLLQQFPDNAAGNHYFTRDVIAPRFIRTTAYDYANAVITHDNTRAKLTLQAMAMLVPHLNLRKRLAFRAVKPLLARPSIAKSMVVFRPFWRRVARLVW